MHLCYSPYSWHRYRSVSDRNDVRRVVSRVSLPADAQNNPHPKTFRSPFASYQAHNHVWHIGAVYFMLLFHNRLNHFLYCHSNRKVFHVNGYIVILKLTRCSCTFLFYLYTVKQFICWSIAQHRFVFEDNEFLCAH